MNGAITQYARTGKEGGIEYQKETQNKVSDAKSLESTNKISSKKSSNFENKFGSDTESEDVTSDDEDKYSMQTKITDDSLAAKDFGW